MADELNWAPGGRALISRSRKHIEFDGNKKAPAFLLGLDVFVPILNAQDRQDGLL